MVPLGCALFAAVLFGPTVWAGFVWDDRAAIIANADLRPTAPWSDLLKHDFWGTPLNHKYVCQHNTECEVSFPVCHTAV